MEKKTSDSDFFGAFGMTIAFVGIFGLANNAEWFYGDIGLIIFGGIIIYCSLEANPKEHE